MRPEPCSTCQTAAWYRWNDERIMLRGLTPVTNPRICDACRERLGRIAAQYQSKEDQ